ncbi:hypothetical protein CHS0354_016123 [Potamilus streckersoni]|uniref:Uncharacterized protein n=1 Tax=Potamilus streckersoni TaxID=2493646 RepID=A0AAE0T1M9_9BIVA|nr:hypothetical protein CHS0354_016123 [Potamilus streckersoni]
MRITFRKVACAILTSYLIVSCYTGYILVRNRLLRESYEVQKLQKISALDDEDWNPWGEEFESEQSEVPHHEPPKILWNLEPHKPEFKVKVNRSREMIVEIWGKAAIGLYLWEHVLEGPLEKKLGGVWSYGTKTVSNITFRFRTGPGVIPVKVPRETENLVLVLNGREPSKVEYAQLWLNSLPNFPHLKNVAVVLLGNEKCVNDWIKPYTEKGGGQVKFVFLVYDSPDIDNRTFFQWPLGVATYRDFPVVDSSQIQSNKQRKYLCNFLGTVYKNASREDLLRNLESSPYKSRCYIKPRYEWVPLERAESREEYVQTVAQSDLTLNPVGQNTECYRIYEALSLGSVPVIEDVMTPGICGKSPASNVYPLRLLKEFKAPVIYIKNWNDLPNMLETEKSLNHSYIARRRKNVLLWYESFKSKLRDRFVNVIRERFFNLGYMQ